MNYIALLSLHPETCLRSSDYGEHCMLNSPHFVKLKVFNIVDTDLNILWIERCFTNIKRAHNFDCCKWLLSANFRLQSVSIISTLCQNKRPFPKDNAYVITLVNHEVALKHNKYFATILQYMCSWLMSSLSCLGQWFPNFYLLCLHFG